MMRTPMMGDIEPGHIYEKAKQLKEEGVNPLDSYPWISQAPQYPGHYQKGWEEIDDHYRDWLIAERKKLYRAVDSEGNIVLIQNPESWKWRNEPEGRTTFFVPKPIPTGEKVKVKPTQWKKVANG